MKTKKRFSVLCAILAALLGINLLFAACTPQNDNPPANGGDTTDTGDTGDKTDTPPQPTDTAPLNLPDFYVNTKDGEDITSKEEYLTCSVTVDYEDTQYEFESAPAKIRGRGNSSWGMPKKSYKLKFDSKVDLFGNGSAKTWTLIANYCDPSLARNYLAYSVGSLFETQPYTTSTQFVQLYLNGEYNGVYLVCEQVQTGKTRVNIDEDFDVVDTGYLLELDVRIEGEQWLDYVSVYDSHFKTRHYQIKSPDPEDVADAGYDKADYAQFIGEYLSSCMDALVSGTYQEICGLVDVESFAESYILNELFNPQDVGDSSFFIYKKKGGKIYSGPVWDYDISTGNCDYPSGFYTQDLSSNPNCLWAKELNPWYYYLLRHEEFKTLVAQKLAHYSKTIEEKITQCVEYLYRREDAFKKNFEVWNIIGTYVWPNPSALVNLKSWRAHVNYVQSWLAKSLKYMKSVYNFNAS